MCSVCVFVCMRAHTEPKLIGLILINEYTCNRLNSTIWCIIRHIIPTAVGDTILWQPKRITF